VNFLFIEKDRDCERVAVVWTVYARRSAASACICVRRVGHFGCRFLNWCSFVRAVINRAFFRFLRKMRLFDMCACLTV